MEHSSVDAVLRNPEPTTQTASAISGSCEPRGETNKLRVANAEEVVDIDHELAKGHFDDLSNNFIVEWILCFLIEFCSCLRGCSTDIAATAEHVLALCTDDDGTINFADAIQNLNDFRNDFSERKRLVMGLVDGFGDTLDMDSDHDRILYLLAKRLATVPSEKRLGVLDRIEKVQALFDSEDSDVQDVIRTILRKKIAMERNLESPCDCERP